MTRKTRDFLFLFFVFLFCILTPAVIFYSQGYRIDVEARKITRTGGFFVKTAPKQVEIYIDGRLAKKTDMLFGNVLIENLLPKNYLFEIKKEGYFPWKKTLAVKGKEVTEAKNITLFPEDLKLTSILPNVKNFWFTPDLNKIILQENGPKGWALKLYEPDKKIKSHLIDEKDLSSKGADLMTVDLLLGSRELLLKCSIREELRYFKLEIERVPPLLTKDFIVPDTPQNILLVKNIGNDVYLLDQNGDLFKNEGREVLASFPVKQETEYDLAVFEDFIFIKESGDLYLYNKKTSEFEKFKDEIEGLSLSPDEKKLLFFSGNEIGVFYLKDQNGQPEKKSGEKTIISKETEKIKDAFWLNSLYFIFNTENKIKIAEIDDRDSPNIMSFSEIKNSKIFWNKDQKQLYILSEDVLYRSEVLVP